MDTKTHKSIIRSRGYFLLAIFVMFALLIAQLPGAAFASTNDGEYYDHFVVYKYASKQALGPGETLTYTILLYNSTTDEVIADVVDTLPVELSVVDGTVSDGGMYDAGQITWSGIEVYPATEVKLTFDAVAPDEIDEVVKVTNVAKVTTSDNVYETETTTTLLPELPVDDVENPVVESVVIDEKDVLTSKDVTLHIKATDNVGVEKMLIQEFQVIEKPNSGKVAWDVTDTTDWIPYEENYDWTLGDLPGVHFVGVWVADAAGNVSNATQNSFDFASYLEEESTFVNKITNVPYAVYYDADVDVTATLTQLTGESGVMLYVWFPGNFGEVDIVGQPGEPVEFTTGKAGTYIFMVGVMAPDPAGVSYNLSITPEGGPSAWGVMPGSVSLNSATESTTMSLFDEVGVDPIAEALSDQPGMEPLVPSADMKTVYLTMIFR
jgi:uncharacterized repeat protein (TIGR01451 family)